MAPKKAPKKVQPKRTPSKVQPKRTPSPVSSSTSSSEDEPENQDNPSQVPDNSSGAALKGPQSAPPGRPQSSSEDDTDDSDSTTQESPDDKEPPSTKRSPQQKAKETSTPSDSESESEPAPDEDNDLPLQRESRTPDPSVKPTVLKPTDDGPAGSAKKRKPPEVASPSTKKNEKNVKPKVSEAAPSPVSKEENNEMAKKRFERLWSLEDEMEILKALVAFKGKHGREPLTADLDSFYNSAKMSFHANFSRSQLGTKLGNLKRKYSKLLTKGKLPKKSADASAAFDLAKEIWGERNNKKGAVLEGGNIDLENGGKSSKVSIPKAKSVKRLTTPSGKSKGDGAKSGPLSLNELGSISEGDDSESSIIDLVANEFNWIGRDSLKKSLALLGPAECKTIGDIWNHLKSREMEFQIQRLAAAKEIMKVLKDKMDS